MQSLGASHRSVPGSRPSRTAAAYVSDTTNHNGQLVRAVIRSRMPNRICVWGLNSCSVKTKRKPERAVQHRCGDHNLHGVMSDERQSQGNFFKALAASQKRTIGQLMHEFLIGDARIVLARFIQEGRIFRNRVASPAGLSVFAFNRVNEVGHDRQLHITGSSQRRRIHSEIRTTRKHLLTDTNDSN